MNDGGVIKILEDLNRSFFLNVFRNIVKTNDGYTLEKVYEENENGEIKETEASKKNPNYNGLTKNCYCCVYNSNEYCMLRSRLEDMPNDCFVFASSVNKCDAYNPVYPLNIMKSKEDMIEFIIKTENFFSSPEDYEDYFGFERSWDDNGNILETVEDYYMRGGEFKYIPKQYPCVIYFSIVDFDIVKNHNNKIKWIYIGSNL